MPPPTWPPLSADDYNRVLVKLDEDFSHDSDRDQEEDESSDEEEDEASLKYINASHIEVICKYDHNQIVE